MIHQLAIFANAGAMRDRFALEVYLGSIIEQYLPTNISVYPSALAHELDNVGWHDATVWVSRSAMSRVLAPKGRLRVQRNRIVNLVCNALTPKPDHLIILWAGSHLGVMGEQLHQRAMNSGIPLDVLQMV